MKPPCNHWQNAILASLPECASWCRYFHNKDRIINIFLTFPANSLEIIPFTLKFEQHGYGAFKIKIQMTLIFILRTACKEDNNKHHYIVV